MAIKKILGLDLGTSSIGWALVNERQLENEKSNIIRTGVRVVPLSTDEQTDFQKGKSISINAERTLKRGARRNLQRYKQRRGNLIEILKENSIVKNDSVLSEDGKDSTHSLWELRAKSAIERIELEEFARVLLSINKKRGYKSNRKAKDEGDGQAIDAMGVAMELYDKKQTPGQYALERLNDDKQVPDFYRSDLQAEFNAIWDNQKQFYSELLTNELKESLAGKNRKATWAICREPFSLVGAKRSTKGKEQKKENYQWRVNGLTEQLDLEQLGIVLQEINASISSSSGYLGAISDRSKELVIGKETVGQYLFNQLKANPHSRLKNQVFYRQDYLDEFETIWTEQSKYHKELTDELKADIRDVVIFYQRRLKSQKGLLDICELEQHEIEIEVDGKKKKKTIGPKVCPKSSPLFQEFKIWQILNNLELKYIGSNLDFSNDTEPTEQTGLKAENKVWVLDLELKKGLFQELSVKGKLTSPQILKFLELKKGDWEINYKDGIEGHRTYEELYKAFAAILEVSGHELDLGKWSAQKCKEAVSGVFNSLGIDTEILEFDASLTGKAFEKQPAYLFWHLLYSYEGDDSRSGNDGLLKKLKEHYGFEQEYAEQLLHVTFQDDHGSLSSKAIRKILPHLKEGYQYDEACDKADYNHSHSVTKEENEKRVLKDELELLPKNSLRNPVVEKILNQMVHVVNGVIAKYGKPDEIRVELARELKKSAKERVEMTRSIAKSTSIHADYRTALKELYPFNTGVRITRNDIIKYKLYKELETLGYKTLYTNTYVPKEKLFSKEFDIEHIIPQAKLFDDSFSNKTISVRQINLDKSNTTAFDFLAEKYGEEGQAFKSFLQRVEKLYTDKVISKAKYSKLLMKEADIPDGFIERDLRNTQFISKKATNMLLELVRIVVPTTGMVTDKLRQDWQLTNVLQDLNWDKYDKLGLTSFEKSKDGRQIRKIKDWTKRNDHRHHAMDAIAVAFTKHNHVQYLNYQNARKDEGHKQHGNIHAIEQKETYFNDKNKRLFKPPMPLAEFRAEAKKHLEQTLISFKAKNKVVTRNKNYTKKKGGEQIQMELTPRGMLHKETVYGKKKRYATKLEKVGPKFDAESIGMVAKQSYRQALLNRLNEFGNDPIKAFGGKNALDKNPIYLDKYQSVQLPEKVKLVWLEDGYTIRKAIGPDLKIDKVIDEGSKRVLQKRLDAYGGDPKKAFANLDEDPIWMNKEKGIQLKRVTISGVSNAEPLHYKKDNHGKTLLDSNGNPIPVDFVSTGNNHHVAIYRDKDEKLQEKVVSFYEAVMRKNAGLHVIDRHHNEDEGWQFLFTMKQNEYFVFPNEETGFDPAGIDLLDESKYDEISANLFRVQKIASKNYFFRHHLETDVQNRLGLNGVSYLSQLGLGAIEEMIKIRINHIGQIVKVGEY